MSRCLVPPPPRRSAALAAAAAMALTTVAMGSPARADDAVPAAPAAVVSVSAPASVTAEGGGFHPAA